MTETKKSREILYWRPALITVIGATLAIGLLGGCSGQNTDDAASLEQMSAKTAAYIQQTVEEPQVSSVGGEWAVIGLKKGDVTVDEDWYDTYYDNLRVAVKTGKGALGGEYNTEYARVTLALCALGKNPADVEGYDLVTPLDDYEKITEQGVNAAAFALIASNVSGITLSHEEAYVQFIEEELSDDAMYQASRSDYIAMALEGLSFYQEREDVKPVIEKGIAALSEYQTEDGSYGNCESTAETIMAVTQLGVDPQKDERFQKNGNNLYDGLLVYSNKDGSFCHVTEDSKGNAMATEKALLAMDAVALQQKGRTLYEREGNTP